VIDDMIEAMLAHDKFPLISDQIDRGQLQVILTELDKVLMQHVEGAVVEFGCYIGTTSLFIRRLLNNYQDERPFHVYDSFEGLPPKTTPDDSPAGTQFKAGELSISKKQFIHEFQKAGLRTPFIHKGWFSDLSPDAIPKKIAFAFLDGDFYESIRDSLKLVLPNMEKGGTIIIDDYAREALPGVAQAVKEYLPVALQQSLRTSHNLGIIHL
jgi:O-methyltransferase